MCVWPFLQTINFLLVPEKNRVVYVSICSLMWTSFLAYMKAMESRRIPEIAGADQIVEIVEIKQQSLKEEAEKTSTWTSALR